MDELPITRLAPPRRHALLWPLWALVILLMTLAPPSLKSAEIAAEEQRLAELHVRLRELEEQIKDLPQVQAQVIHLESEKKKLLRRRQQLLRKKK